MVNNNSKAFLVAKYAVMLALIFVGTVIDRSLTAYLPITGASVEMLMTLSLCFLFNSWLDGILAGTLMGLSSFVTAFMFGKILPQNPLISVMPRIFVGILAFSVYRLMLLILKKVDKKALHQTIAIVPACLIGLITNTVLFLGAATLFSDQYGSLVEAMAVVTFLGILPEYSISLVCVAPLVLGVRRGLKLGIDGNNWKLARNDEMNVETDESDNNSDTQDNVITNDEDKTL